TGSNTRNTFDELEHVLLERFKAMLSSSGSTSQNQHVRKARLFYRNCADTDRLNLTGLKYLLNTIEKNGGWPLMELERW
ncbi:unnamed protein product, partial [Allacma fusca]